MWRSGSRLFLIAGLLAGAAATPLVSASRKPPEPAAVLAPGELADSPSSRARIALGRRLFYDADLSINGTLSCATCHEQRLSFSDGVQTHPGAHGEPGLRNVPSLLNVGGLSPLTWGNSALTTLERQAIVPITGTDPVEMGMKGHEDEIPRRLSSNPCYRRLFLVAYPESRGRIDLPSVLAAISSFERTIVSYDTLWDHSRNGSALLSPLAARGAALFQGSAGCATCHAGVNFTDARFHRLASPDTRSGDSGLQRATRLAEDAGKFRTPSLRNVSLTAPYLHDGSAKTLAEAISRHGIRVGDSDLEAIEAFLADLTDQNATTNPRLALPGTSCRMDF